MGLWVSGGRGGGGGGRGSEVSCFRPQATWNRSDLVSRARKVGPMGFLQDFWGIGSRLTKSEELPSRPSNMVQGLKAPAARETTLNRAA